MKREIKCCGKRLDNGELTKGDLIQLHDGRKYIVDSIFGACIDDKGNFINTKAPYVNEVDPETVRQFSGEKDVQGNEVYESSIIEWEIASTYKCRGVVKIKDCMYCVEAKGATVSLASALRWGAVVVGNELDGTEEKEIG